MRPIDPEEMLQYIRQIIQQEEQAFNIKEGQPVDYAEYRNIAETVANAAAHWAIGMARDDSEYNDVAPPLAADAP